MAEIVEEADLLLAEPPHGVVLRQAGDQLSHPRPQLEREVRSGGPDERLDVVECRLCHRGAEA